MVPATTKSYLRQKPFGLFFFFVFHRKFINSVSATHFYLLIHLNIFFTQSSRHWGVRVDFGDGPGELHGTSSGRHYTILSLQWQSVVYICYHTRAYKGAFDFDCFQLITVKISFYVHGIGLLACPCKIRLVLSTLMAWRVSTRARVCISLYVALSDFSSIVLFRPEAAIWTTQIADDTMGGRYLHINQYIYILYICIASF